MFIGSSPGPRSGRTLQRYKIISEAVLYNPSCICRQLLDYLVGHRWLLLIFSVQLNRSKATWETAIFNI